MKRIGLIISFICLGTLAAAYDGPYPPEAPAVTPDWAVTSRNKVIKQAPDPHERGLKLGGPRFGGTYISGAGFEKLKEQVQKTKPGTELEPFMTHFGWQVEYRMFRTESGLTALTEIIPIVGGLDQGLALPSLNWIVGVRGSNGFEVGVGPNIGLNGASLIMATGFTFDLGGINVPLNLAVGQASKTTSVSMSIGFNL